MCLMRRLVAFSLISWHLAAFSAETVRFPRPEFEGDRRYDYAMQLLRLALSKSGTDYLIRVSDLAMNKSVKCWKSRRAGLSMSVQSPGPPNERLDSSLFESR